MSKTILKWMLNADLIQTLKHLPDYEVQRDSDVYVEYDNLANQYMNCAHIIIDEILNKQDIAVLDTWFIPSLLLMRQGIELEVKALLLRIYRKKMGIIQNMFSEKKHRLADMVKEVIKCSEFKTALTNAESTWILDYLDSLETMDSKSDLFRYPFSKKFSEKVSGLSIDIISTSNSAFQAFNLLKSEVNGKNKEFKLEMECPARYLTFVTGEWLSCHLYTVGKKSKNDKDDIDEKKEEIARRLNFSAQIRGYKEVVDFLFLEYRGMVMGEIAFPFIYLTRHLVELQMKQLIAIGELYPYRNVITHRIDSHSLKRLFKKLSPLINSFMESAGDGEDFLNVDIFVNDYNVIDNKGDAFRYPTDLGMRQYFNHKSLKIEQIFLKLRFVDDFVSNCTMYMNFNLEHSYRYII